MTLWHSNPAQQRYKPKKDRKQNLLYEYWQWAYAPYNFISLPERLVTVKAPLPFDRFEGLSGTIVCEIETCSPTYTRGMLTRDQFDRFGSKKAEDLKDEEKLEHAGFYSPDLADTIEEFPKPKLPGSALRGMIRGFVEIIGFGKMRWVNDSPRISFRAVAASPKTDALAAPYKKLLSPENLAAGYLIQKGESWAIQPAKAPRDIGCAEDAPYLKVNKKLRNKQNKFDKEATEKRLADLRSIPGFRDFDDDDYLPANLPVSFTIGDGRQDNWIHKIAGRTAGLEYEGVLVCSGNMIETTQMKEEKQAAPQSVKQKKRQPSPRQVYALVLARDENRIEIPISIHVVEDYRESLTEFQRSKPFDSVNGCLKNGEPVFYATDDAGKVAAFGHTPNFRIPARRLGSKRASTPRDFVPAFLQDDDKLDLADALFGWTPEPGGKRRTSMAGRVFFEDAVYVGHKHGVWHQPTPIIPEILATPKPTTFQHYLVQDQTRGHDPDKKEALAHYATPESETAIRGYKCYWHKGEAPKIEIEATADELAKKHSQLTRMRPIKAGVSFRGKIHFENLQPVELGALLWALALPGKAGETYRHKFGMGKPLGMGALAIQTKLYLTARKPLSQPDAQPSRYEKLFGEKEEWHTATSPAEATTYLNAFEEYVRAQIGAGKKRFAELSRIQALLTMLQWREHADELWLKWTDYMKIEHPEFENQYSERPVLPNPQTVVDLTFGRKLRPAAVKISPLPETPKKHTTSRKSQHRR